MEAYFYPPQGMVASGLEAIKENQNKQHIYE
jgi:hypothetical protein